MTDVTTALDAVGALTGERMEYENWITALATKSDVPAHVLDKVRADYTGRLRTVLQAFTAHAPALEAALAEIQSRDAMLSGQEQACRDEHAEGELRHMVGEYDGEQWEKVRLGHEGLLKRVSAERQGLAAELSAVQRSLSATADAAQRGRTIGDPGLSAPAREAVFTPQTPSVSEPVVLPAIDALAPFTPGFLPPEPVRAPAAVPHATEAPRAASPMQDARRGADDDFGFLRSTPRESPVEQNSAATGTMVTPPEANVSPSSSPPPPPPAADPAKTLRCGECGTMNYATEWYCERCGGELAVL
ncbi:MAG: hypothetical protein H7305_12995 [Gemmatimonadaceae bacterium]|nr:hypothetical protein [Gemmatimonadaceae bacterium]